MVNSKRKSSVSSIRNYLNLNLDFLAIFRNEITTILTPSTSEVEVENIEHKSMKQISYSGKYSFSASRAHQSHLQFSFAVGMLSLR